MSPPPPRLAASALLLLVCASACSPDSGPGRANDTPRPHEALTVRPGHARLAPRDSTRAPRPAPTREPATPPPLVFDTTGPEAPLTPAAPSPPPRPEPPRESPEPLPRPPPRLPPARDAGPAVAGSCDVRPSEDYCFAYSGPAWTRASAASHCAAVPEAAFRPGPCPTSGRIATCTFRRPSDPAREIVYTTYAPADLALARLACPGVFELVEP